MEEAYYREESVIPSLSVNATFITPFQVKSYNNLLLEINTLAERIKIDIYSSFNYNKYKVNNQYDNIKCSYFLSFQNNSYSELSIQQEMDMFMKTSIQLLSSSTDELLIRNKIYTDICNSMGVPSAQVTYARVFFNGNPIGFFQIKENPNVDYFKWYYDTSDFYSQINGHYSQMLYNGEFHSEFSDPKYLNKPEFDNYSNYWYQGKEVADFFHDKNDLANLFKKFHDKSSMEDINNMFSSNTFLKAMALDYVVNNEHSYLYNATNFILFLNKVNENIFIETLIYIYK